MAIPKVMGTETEYGIAAAGQPDFNPVLSSSMLISAYAGSLRKIRWDYEDESPMRDARGFEPQPGREMSDEDLGLANVILPTARATTSTMRTPSTRRRNASAPAPS